MFAFAAGALAALPEIEEPHRTGATSAADSAVIVGIEDYFVLPDVPYATRDAEAFYDFAVYTRGVPSDRVTLLTGPVSREKLTAALQAAGKATRAGGTVFVYFAGHGAASPSTGERMLIGADAQADLDTFQARGVSVADVRAWSTAGGGSAVLVLDTCYSGRSRAGGEVVAGKRFAVPAYATAPAPKVVEWTAAGPDQWSGPLDAARHGAFTYLAVGALRGWADGQKDGVRDGAVTVEEASLYVEEGLRTLQIRDQRPERVGAGAMVLSAGREEAPSLSAGDVAVEAPEPVAPTPRARPAFGGLSQVGKVLDGAVTDLTKGFDVGPTSRNLTPAATDEEVQAHLARMDRLFGPDQKVDYLRGVAAQERFTCAQVVQFVDALVHPTYQIAGVRALRGSLVDPENHGEIEAVMAFPEDRRQIAAMFPE